MMSLIKYKKGEQKMTEEIAKIAEDEKVVIKSEDLPQLIFYTLADLQARLLSIQEKLGIVVDK